MHDPLVYLNGAFVPLSEARIPVLDRGFIFGDGVYDVIPVYARRPFREAQHLARLARSLDAVRIPNPHSTQEWQRLIRQLIDAQPESDQFVYLQVTRGVAKRAHAFPQDVVPTVFMMSNPLAPQPVQSREMGVACISTDDLRWLRCNIKSVSLLGNVLAAQQAVEHDAVEAIQFRDGWLTEGASSNVWIVTQREVLGPPADNLILEGIRYELMRELCAACGLGFGLRRISRDEVFGADEVLLSSAGKEVLPVSSIDGRAIGSGKPGPVYRMLYDAYQAAKAASP